MAGKQFDPVFAGAFLSLRDALQLEMQTQASRRPFHAETAGRDGVKDYPQITQITQIKKENR